MKINCLACGHNVELGEVYDDYEGQVKCYICGALLAIKTEGGNIKSLEFLKIVRPSVRHASDRS